MPQMAPSRYGSTPKRFAVAAKELCIGRHRLHPGRDPLVAHALVEVVPDRRRELRLRVDELRDRRIERQAADRALINRRADPRRHRRRLEGMQKLAEGVGLGGGDEREHHGSERAIESNDRIRSSQMSSPRRRGSRGHTHELCLALWIPAFAGMTPRIVGRPASRFTCCASLDTSPMPAPSTPSRADRRAAASSPGASGSSRRWR